MPEPIIHDLAHLERICKSETRAKAFELYDGNRIFVHGPKNQIEGKIHAALREMEEEIGVQINAKERQPGAFYGHQLYARLFNPKDVMGADWVEERFPGQDGLLIFHGKYKFEPHQYAPQAQELLALVQHLKRAGLRVTVKGLRNHYWEIH